MANKRKMPTKEQAALLRDMEPENTCIVFVYSCGKFKAVRDDQWQQVLHEVRTVAAARNAGWIKHTQQQEDHVLTGLGREVLKEMEKAMSEENRDPRVCPKLGDVFRRENGVVMRITAVAEDRIDWTSQDGDHRLKNWHGSRSTWEDFVEVYTKVIHAE